MGPRSAAKHYQPLLGEEQNRRDQQHVAPKPGAAAGVGSGQAVRDDAGDSERRLPRAEAVASLGFGRQRRPSTGAASICRDGRFEVPLHGPLRFDGRRIGARLPPAARLLGRP